MYGLLIASTMLVLLSASVYDIRTREVPDIHWTLLGMLAVCTWLLDDDVMSTLACISMMACMFTERSHILLCPTIMIVVSIIHGSWYSLSIASMGLIIMTLYWTGLVKGGADAKALIVISMLFPVWNHGLIWDADGVIPYVFNPTIGILFTSLLMSLSYCIVILARNLRDGNIHRRMLTSYYIGGDDAEESFVWQADVTTDGPVMVTPMIPFLPPITISFIVVVALGNPMLALI